jgi:hypothetical protein
VRVHALGGQDRGRRVGAGRRDDEGAAREGVRPLMERRDLGGLDGGTGTGTDGAVTDARTGGRPPRRRVTCPVSRSAAASSSADGSIPRSSSVTASSAAR